MRHVLHMITTGTIDHSATTGLIHGSEEIVFPSHIEITPAIVHHMPGGTQSYHQQRLQLFPPKSVLCELQPVEVAEQVLTYLDEPAADEIVDWLNIDDDSVLTTDQGIVLLKHLLKL